MGNLATGGQLLLFVLAVTFMVAYLQDGTTEAQGFQDCSEAGNQTVCDSTSSGSFMEAVLSVSVNGIDGAPDVVNGFYLLTMGGLLVLSIILIIAGFAGVPFGGG